MSVLNNTGILAGASGAVGGDTGYNPKRSTRFNTNDSAHLSRTPSLGNRKTWTWSGWLKRSSFDQYSGFFSAMSISTNYFFIGFGNDQLSWYNRPPTGTQTFAYSAALFRDQAAFYHVVLAWNTTENTGSDRVKMYVNGERITVFSSSTWPSLNESGVVNDNLHHELGARNYGGSYSFNGLISDVNFVDGLALDPTSFGEPDATTGQWVPKEYTAPIPTEPTYSNYVSGSIAASPYDATKMFDGSITSFTDHNGQNTTITWTHTLTSVTSLRVYIHGGNSTNTVTTVGGSGTQTDTISTNFGPGWHTISLSSTGSTINSIAFARGGSGNPLSIYAVEVNGAVLEDTFGYNSFHLAMDPAESGTTYSDYISGTPHSGYSITAPFNGAVATYSDGVVPALNTSLTFTPPSKITCSEVKLWYCLQTNAGTAHFKVNGTTITTTAANTPVNTVTVDVTSNGGLSSVVWGPKDSSQSNSGVWLVAIACDGEMLIDHTAIGYDSSGSENHWHENNLVADATDYSGTGSFTATGTQIGGLENAYDGDVGTDGGATTGISKWGRASGTATHSGFSIPVSDTVAIRVIYNVNVGGGSILVNGVSKAANVPSGGNNTWGVIDWSATELSNAFESIAISSPSGGVGVYVSGIEADGILLVDGVPAELDLLADTPGAPYDNGANGGGNYATLNPLQNALTLSNGNLTFDIGSRSNWKIATATIHITSGKWYWEITNGTQNTAGGNIAYGLRATDASSSFTNELGYNDGNKAYFSSNTIRDGTTSSSSYGASFGTNDVIGVAFDADNGTLIFYKNGVSQGTAFTGLTGSWSPAIGLYTGGTQLGTDNFHINFGQRPFDNLPTGYKALNTYNLDPLIDDPSTVFNTKLYTGTGSNQAITGLEFEPDLVWIKSRSAGGNTRVYDIIRGATNHLLTSEAYAETSSSKCLSAFNSDGFSVSGNGSETNSSNVTYAAWNWDAGAAANPTSVSVGSLNSSVYNTSSWISNTTVNNLYHTHNIETLFNGDTHNIHGASSNTLHLQWSSGTIQGQVRLKLINAGSPGNHQYKDNGGSAVNIAGVTGTAAWIDLGNIDLTDYYAPHPSGGNAAIIEAIELDGKILIDSGQTPPDVPSIASEYKANTDAGFSIVSFDSNSSAVTTVGHGLSAEPNFILWKDRDAATNWFVYHNAGTAYMFEGLNNTNAGSTTITSLNNTLPSSSVFTLNSGGYSINPAGNHAMIAYCWAPVECYSKFGSFEGNNSADGPFVHCGFSPRWIMLRAINSSSDWIVWDTARDTYNVAESLLYANLNNAEDEGIADRNPDLIIDVLSNGFKCRGTNNDLNASEDYLYCAFAESPFKYSNAR